MYGLLWRKLPGHWTLKTLEALVLLVAVCALLLGVVFPWVEPKLPFSGNTIDGGGSSSPAATPTTRPTVTAPATPSTPKPTVSAKPSPKHSKSASTDVPDVLPGE